MSNQKERLESIQIKNQKILQEAMSINAKIEAASEQEKKLSALLKEKYGTDNIQELEKKSIQMENENEEMLSLAEKELTEIEIQIKQANLQIQEIQEKWA